jgi:hypothetical protein
MHELTHIGKEYYQLLLQLLTLHSARQGFYV